VKESGEQKKNKSQTRGQSTTPEKQHTHATTTHTHEAGGEKAKRRESKKTSIQLN